MTNLLFHSLDPKENYKKTCQSLLLIALLYIGIAVYFYLNKSYTQLILSGIVLLCAGSFEYLCAQKMRFVTDQNTLETAYRNGKVIDSILKIAFIIYLLIIFNWKIGLVLAIPVTISLLYRWLH